MTKLQKLGLIIARRPLGARSFSGSGLYRSSSAWNPCPAPPPPKSELVEGLKCTAISFCVSSVFLYSIDFLRIRTVAFKKIMEKKA